MEQIAADHLADQQFEVYLPRQEEPRGRHGELRLVPTFPGYLFVRFDVRRDAWRPIVSTVGVRRLIPPGPVPERPIPVPVGWVEAFRARADAAGITSATVIEATPIAEGVQAEIVAGVYAGRTGICQWSTLDRIRLLMDVLGGLVPVEMPRADVRVE